MIRSLSETLQAILDDPTLAANFPDLEAAAVVFTAPNDTFTLPGGATAAIDLFLYDIRENLELRTNEPELRYENGVAIVSAPPRRIDCTYVVTAWPDIAPPVELREHRLLSQALQVLGQYPTIPPQYLLGSLANQEPPLPMLAPQIDGLKSPAEFWTAMGNDVRASFTLTATISMPALPDIEGAPVTTTRTGFHPAGGLDTEVILQIGGEVHDALGSGPIASALVEIPALGLKERTNNDGRYTFGRVPTGAVQFRVAAVGFQPDAPVRTVPGPPENYRFELTPIP